MTTPSPNRQTALDLINAFTTLDIPSSLAPRSQHCTWTMLPASLSFPPALTNAQHAAHMQSLTDVSPGFDMYVQEVWDGGNTVVVHALSDLRFREEVTSGDEGVEWKYRGEYMFVVDFDAEGKVVRVIEFLDSKAVGEALGLAGRGREILAARKSAGGGGEEGKA
jgi:ketosteroid isomerase-like protein